MILGVHVDLLTEFETQPHISEKMPESQNKRR